MIKIFICKSGPRKGISEIEGKAVRVAAKKRGQRLSFKVGTQETLFLPKGASSLLDGLEALEPWCSVAHAFDARPGEISEHSPH